MGTLVLDTIYPHVPTVTNGLVTFALKEAETQVECVRNEVCKVVIVQEFSLHSIRLNIHTKSQKIQ